MAHASSVLSPDAWRALRLASIRGITDKELSSSFGVSVNTIVKKRTRDAEWKAACVTKVVTKPLYADTPAILEKVVSDNLEHIAQENPVMVANYAHKALKEAFESGMVPTPSTWADVSAATKLVRQAVGLDREGQVNVQVGIWGGQYEAFDGPTVDV